MWKKFLFLAILGVSCEAFASDLVKDLSNAASQARSAAVKASFDRRLAEQKMLVDERVSCASMGHRECAQAIALSRAKGPDYSGMTPISAAFEQVKRKGKEIYASWIVGKSPEQVSSAKRLFAAWLTQLDTLAEMDDPLSLGRTPAGVAYAQAVNEFQIDNPPE